MWTAIFEEGSLGPLLGVSGLALLAVYGPLLAGFLASAVDPTTSRQDLYRRMRTVRVGSAWYLRALFILIAVTAVPALVLAAFTGLASDAPSLPRLGGFLVVFFVFQLFTSGLEEPGWRGLATSQPIITLTGHGDRTPPYESDSRTRSRVDEVVFRPGTHELYSAGYDGTIRAWNIETGKSHPPHLRL